VRFLLSLLVLFASLGSQVVASEPVNDAALMQKRPAKLISAYNLFKDAVSQEPNQGLHPFSLSQPLFTDYALKYRFVYMPNGTNAVYDETEAFDFPVGTVLVKTFAYPADFRKPDQDLKLIETRLLIHQEKGWNAWAYVWNEDQSDAVLKVAGKTLPVSWIDVSGETRAINYVVPNKNQCKGCHTFDKKFSPIGPKARNLNTAHDYDSGTENQLAYWSARGLLDGAPAPEDAPSVPKLDDVAASLNDRARAYLDINCAHCHRLEGPASTSGLFLTYGETREPAWGYKKRPVAAGRGSGGLDYDIAPGDPEKSILIYRMNSVDPGIMMPELGRSTIHTEGVELLREWIKGLK
jgi:uncharacterized repeat protein (TIGR03806 family)